MEKLKVGTKVRIKKNLKCGKAYGIGKINPDMLKYNGLETEIETVKGFGYWLKGVGYWCYQPEMFDVIK